MTVSGRNGGHLQLRLERFGDPEGHGADLLLKGDWLFAGLSDGNHVGWGEASLSGDDDHCCEVLQKLVGVARGEEALSVEGIAAFHQRLRGRIHSFVDATASSAIEQALHELAALRADLPVWGLYTSRPVRPMVPAYATINRALTTRDADDYVATVELALERGFAGVKCAPFDKVTLDGNQVSEAQAGFEVLELLRERFPALNLRVDCHERFTPGSFIRLLPRFHGLNLTWVEAPCPIGTAYAEFRKHARVPIAAGELLFGSEPFREICEQGWADVVMPDVKHVGGVGPALEVCAHAARNGVEVSLHNVSGPLATLASIHCAAVSSTVTSIEVALRRGTNPSERLLSEGGLLGVPTVPGWGHDGSPHGYGGTHSLPIGPSST